jgi:hypothetical protein
MNKNGTFLRLIFVALGSLPRKSNVQAVAGFLTLLLGVRTSGQSIYEPYTFVTFAGLSPGSADGVGIEARLNRPCAVAADHKGKIYVADTSNNTIRKVTPSGVVTTVAGLAGVSGSQDGTSSTARFNQPYDLTVDTSGNLFVADTGNNLIRKVTPAGEVSTLAGAAIFGAADGTGREAGFAFPMGVAVDTVGNVYVADSENRTIRKVTATGVVTTLAGQAQSAGSVDGSGSAVRFGLPYGLVVGPGDNLYVGDANNNSLRKVTPAGVVTTLARLVTNSGSAGIAVDAGGNVYVADVSSHTIQKLTPEGLLTTWVGLAMNPGNADGARDTARFLEPRGVAVDQVGNLYVADSGNSTLRKITPAGVVTTLAGRASVGSEDGTGSGARFYGPGGVAVDSAGNLYVADTGNSTIRKITPAGTVTTLAGQALNPGSADGHGSAAGFDHPSGVTVDSQGNLYVTDTYPNYTIRKVTPEGDVTTVAGQVGWKGNTDGTGGAARFNVPNGIAADSGGNVYVADTNNDSIRKITPSGDVTTVAKDFCWPNDVAVDQGGNLYVTEHCDIPIDSVILKVTPDGLVTTWAGSAGHRGSQDGSDGRFNVPLGVAVDDAGNVYVADTGNQTIRKITPAGEVRTLAGLAGSVGSTDGTGSDARFSHPDRIAVDNFGNLYVADSANNTIRKGFPALTIANARWTPDGSQIEFRFTGRTGRLAVIESTADLVTWQPISTNTIAGAVDFTEHVGVPQSHRFYRVRTN